jgi:putative MFS transporter
MLFGLASIAASFAPNMTVLIVIRFVMGLGMGAEIVVGYSSLAEFMPRAKRGRYVALLSMVTNLAVPVTGLGGAWLIPLIGWRWLFAIVGAGALIVWALRKNMPESPRWLESRGRAAEAEAMLAAIEAEAARSGKLPPVIDAVEEAPAPGRYGELVGAGLIRCTVLGIVIACVSGVSLYGFLSWIPTFLVKQGLSIGSSLWFSGIMGLGAPLGALLGAFIADRFGRVRSLTGLAVCEAVLGLVYPMVGNGVELIAVGFGVTLCAYAIVAVGFALYIPEMFPTRLRLRGASVVLGISRLSSSQVGFVIVLIFGAFGIGGVAGFLSGSMVLMALAVILLGRETSNRSLEAIAVESEPAGAPAAALLLND